MSIAAADPLRRKDLDYLEPVDLREHAVDDQQIP